MSMHIPRVLVGVGVFLSFFIPALPDTTPYSPRSLVTAVSLGLIGVGTYFGAQRPTAEKVKG